MNLGSQGSRKQVDFKRSTLRALHPPRIYQLMR